MSCLGCSLSFAKSCRSEPRIYIFSALIRAIRSASEPAVATGVSVGVAPLPGVVLRTGLGVSAEDDPSGRTAPVTRPIDGSMSASTRRGRSRPGGLTRRRFASAARGVCGFACDVGVVARDPFRVAVALRVLARVLVCRVARVAGGFPVRAGRFCEGRGRLADARGRAFDRGPDFANEGSSGI